MLAALNQFISKFADRYRPFYQLLKKWTGFRWSEECDKSFIDLKDYLSLLKRLDFTGRIAKWGTKLGSFDIRYRPRSSVKGQVLTDFIVEFSPKGNGEIVCQLEVRPWKVFMDGASNSMGAGAGVVVITPEGIRLEHSFRLCFKASNNEAEYEAFLAGLRTLSSLGARDVKVYSDSHLVVNQVQGSFEACDPRMKAYLEQVKQAIASFSTVKMDPIIDFLAEDWPPDDEKEGCKVGELLADLHDGVCGSHVGGRSLAHRAMTQGFWWPQMQKDSAEYVLKCKQCQKHVPLIHQPASHLNPISSPWPFAQWGLDIIGPFPRAAGNRRFVLVAIDYFTKWAEPEALANIRDVDVKKFVWKNIVTRFWVPNSLISDNGLQFDSRAFRGFCRELGIKNRYSTPAYPQSNSQAEAVNKVIVDGLKKRLVGAKGNWAKELPKVLWAYRTTPRRSTGETFFSLA
nr:uncharacterized protein LOC111989456 [Quercus suber]